MDETDSMDRLERFREACPQRTGSARVQGTLPSYHLVQRRSLNVGTRVPRRVAVGIAVDDGSGVEAADALGGLDLVPKPGAEGRITVEQVGVDDLDSDFPTTLRSATVDLSHPARAQAAFDDERPDPPGIVLVQRLH